MSTPNFAHYYMTDEEIKRAEENEEPRESMTFKDYQDKTAETAIYPGKFELLGLAYVGLGLGEAGEVQGKIKKIIRDSKGIVTDETRRAVADEVGDLLWYCSQLCTELGVSMSIVAKNNLLKLKSRKERGKIQGSGDNR